MTASYRKIDYRIRPAKHVERLMMCEAFRRLRFGRLEDYHYIGLGSVYFSDFALFHRSLGIRRMTSIESQENDKERFNYNLPFANIDMKWGRTSKVLPGIDLSSRSIIWLDYDGTLEKGMLDDLRSVASRIATGSIVALSVQCKAPPYDPLDPRKSISELEEKIGADRIDPTLTDESLIGWGCARTVKKILTNELEFILQQRNGGLNPGQKFVAEQVLNFHYSDGANMLTVAWVIHDEGQRPIFNLCNFEGLDFFRNAEEAFRIDIPKLTPLELKKLSTQMPLNAGATASIGPIPQSDADSFIKIYRYFPNITFVDV